MSGRVAIVAGLPRCGSSLVCRMLAAGGVPVLGDRMTFEDLRVPFLPDEHEWLGEAAGKALKILHPLRFAVPEGLPCDFVWLDRDAGEQAKSQEKLGLRLGTRISAGERMALPGVLAMESARARRELPARHPNARFLFLTFEGLLSDPEDAAEALATWAAAATGIRPVVRRMVAEVYPREAACLPDMLEDRLPPWAA